MELGFAGDCKETRMDVMAATEYLARSTTLTSVGWIGYIIIGGLAGALASKIIRGSGAGILMDIVIGIVGALIGGFILSFFVNTAGGGLIFTFLTALLGALILLWIVGMVRRT
ncbi:membrane protein [Mycobacterium heidelbergense]|nr:membrane protein [Mycobacterium heidelbergense]